MADGTGVSLRRATLIAESLLEDLQPHCERATIAGSIRREKAEVGDVEIVVIPRWGEKPDDGLGLTMVPANLLHEWALATDAVRWIKPSTHEIIDWAPKAEGKYWRGLLPSGLKLDLFLARPENYGAILLIRTGSAGFSEAVVTHAKRIGKPCVEGQFTDPGGRPVATYTESEVFEHLGLEWVAPRDRTGPEALGSQRPASRRAWAGGAR